MNKLLVRLVSIIFLCAASANAQDSFPNRPIRLVVGFPPGGSTDISARVLAQRLGASLGQPVIVENRAGAGGHVATLAVAGAQPDGHTLLWANSSQVVLPAVFKQDPNFDPLRDLTAVTAATKVDSLLVVSAASGITSFKQFVSLLQDKAQKKAYGTQGAGTPGHIMNAWVATRSNAANTIAVHYKGATNSEADFLSGQITYRFDTVTTLKRLGNKLNCLASLTEKRLPDAPDCPTFAEVGMPLDIDWTLWNSVHAPGRMSKPLVDRLYGAVAKILADAEFAKELAKFGITPLLGYTPEKTRALQEQQMREWSEAVKRMGITTAE
ncbi:MAG: Bug family tripartite tricarboxylate transporter substrate binding protein [Burkholderiales bacterium]